jgi:hypothetical protein
MQAVTGLLQSGWSLQRMKLDGAEVTTIYLYHEKLELSYILEHHKNKETFDDSTLQPFVRSKRIGMPYYEREQPFPEDPKQAKPAR